MRTRLLDLAAAISVGVPRVIIDGAMICALGAGIFWAGRVDDQISELTYRGTNREQLASDLAVVTARQGIILNDLTDIKARLNACERKNK